MKTQNIDENKDRISDLPNCVLLLILSILNTKEAVQTCVLSARWKNLWKYIPVLSISSFHFETRKGFTRFVSQFLYLRDKKTSLHTLNFHRQGVIRPRHLKRVIKYAVDHGVQLLDVDSTCYHQDYPLPYVSCHTLTSLTLTNNHIGPHSPLFPTSLNLPALTSLCLKYVAFHGSGDDNRAEPFSSFNSLKSLIIHCCVEEQNLFISNDTLVYLRINTFSCYRCCKIELSTPSLRSFDFQGNPVQNLSGNNNNLSSIKHVKIDVAVPSYIKKYPLVLLNWLVEFSLIESLTVSLSTLETLCLVPGLWKVDFPYLQNLKLLKIITYQRSAIPEGIVDFLLQNSPLTKAEIIDLPRHWSGGGYYLEIYEVH